MHHALIFNVSTDQFNRPGGAHRIATLLREENWDVEVCDYADEWQLTELHEFCNSRITSNTKFIGFSCFFDHWSEKMNRFVHWLKLRYPDIVIIRGGQVATDKQYTSFEHIDYHVAGYGENVILELLKKILGNDHAFIPFDPYFASRKIRLIKSNSFFPSWPMRRAGIIYQARDFIEPWEWSTVEFGRGCKFHCPYCNFPVLGVKGDYTRDADDFDYQLRHAYDNWGITNYYCADETFNDRSEKIIKFADVAEKLNFTPFISAFVRADLVAARPQDWEHFLRLGVLGHFYGVESFNHETSKLIGKGMSYDKLTTRLTEAKNFWMSHGTTRYRGTVALIIGLPKETRESLELAITWIRNYWQGQNYVTWPLEITKNLAIDNESKISKNYQEYGYERIRDDIDTKDLKLVKNNNSLLNWKNQHFTFTEAASIADDFENEKSLPDYNYTHGAFELATFSILGNLDTCLGYQTTQYREFVAARRFEWQKFIQRYIHKKLS